MQGVGGGRFGIHIDGFPYIRFAGTGDGQWHCVLSVSYTHLDVYKRQPLSFEWPTSSNEIEMRTSMAD